MKTKESSRRYLVCGLIFLVLFVVTIIPLYSQETRDSVGIDLYKRGEFANAVTSLQASADCKDLYYLGLSYEHLGKGKDAKKAFEKSFKSGYQQMRQDYATSRQRHPKNVYLNCWLTTLP